MRILVCEDEPHVAGFIRNGLTENGFTVENVYDGTACLEQLKKDTFDLVLLDIVMPHKNGWEVCRSIRQELKLDVPIIMLTALNSSREVVKGLETGADDYVGKPFTMEELMARIRAVSRRVHKEFPHKDGSVFSFGNIRLDMHTREVSVKGQSVNLTSKEYYLLEYFLKNPQKVLSREQILDAVWGIDFDVGTNVVDVYINYLRNKLAKAGSARVIQTKVGMGYILKHPEN